MNAGELRVCLESALGSASNPLPAFKQALKECQGALKNGFTCGAPVVELVHARADLVDTALKAAWHRFVSPDDASVALVAVGGYGRGELHPGSDIDILILLRGPDHDHYSPRIESLLTFLWDIGLEVGHSVRSVQECITEAAQDITVATNLMESRRLSGPEDLYDAMRTAIGPAHIWSSRDFFKAKLNEQIARHHKYHDTAYNLEPNVKEGPGGLRDIQMIGWVAKRHFGAETLYDLVSHGFLTEDEYHALKDGQDFLWQVRFALHVLTGRREDRLLFDYQRTLAQQFGYQDGNANLAVEQFMKRYYRAIMELSRLNEMLLQLFEEAILYADDPGEPTPINKRFQARKGFIEAVDERVFQRYPFALLEMFLLLAQHPELKGVRASTIRLMRGHRFLIDETFRQDLRNRSLFMEILRQPRGVSSQLRRMNRYGILAAYMPAFGNVVGLMQYDLFHVYTVDEHTLMVIRNLRRFAMPDYNHEFPVCSEIMQHIPKPEILYLAAMFHDIAKGRGGDHSELGAEEAISFCLHHGMSQYDARMAAWLVRNHLIMSMTSQRKDISDPEIVLEFANLVGDQAHLDYLYLLTVCDIRGTNPSLWNNWKDVLLRELYFAAKRAFRLGLESVDQRERVAEVQREAREILGLRGTRDEAGIEALWKSLTDDYFCRYSAEEIACHTEAITHLSEKDIPLILILHHMSRGGTEIFIHTRLDDRLFARVTATLAQAGLTIVDARITSSRTGYTFDTYIVLEESGEPIGNPHRIEEIHRALQRQLADLDRPPPPISRRAPRRHRYFPTPTAVHFTSDEHNQRTIVELTATDRPGLLSQVGMAMIGCDARLQNAKIATFGARIEDIFFVTNRANRPLDEAAQQCLRDAIVQALDQAVAS